MCSGCLGANSRPTLNGAMNFFMIGSTSSLDKLCNHTPAAHGLEELFSAVLEKFLQPINAPWVYGT